MPSPSVMFVVAHSSRSRGVPTQVPSLDEYAVSQRASLAAMRYLLGEYESELYDVGPVLGDGAYLPRKISKVNQCSPSLAIEIHCNGGPPEANYREVIHSAGSALGALAAEHVAHALSIAFPAWKPCAARPNDIARDKHLFYFLRNCRPPAIIVEGLFLSNPEQQRRVGDVGGAEDYGIAVGTGVKNFLDYLAKQGDKIS